MGSRYKVVKPFWKKGEKGMLATIVSYDGMAKNKPYENKSTATYMELKNVETGEAGYTHCQTGGREKFWNSVCCTMHFDPSNM